MKPVGRLFTRAPAFAAVVVCFIAALTGAAIRYWFYEPETFGSICYYEYPWWCVFRTFIAIETRHYGFGWTSLALATIGLIRIWMGRSPTPFAYGALVIGGMGLLLYDTTLSAPAVLLATLSLVRAPERAA